MRARLVSLDGGPPIDLVKDVTVFGRGEDCDVRLAHKSVSKTHCVIVKTDGTLLLRDLGSTNGTHVNGQRVRRAALLPDDTLALAHLRFRVQYGAGLADEPAPSAQPPAAAPPEAAPPLLRRNALPDVYPDPQPRRQPKKGS